MKKQTLITVLTCLSIALLIGVYVFASSRATQKKVSATPIPIPTEVTVTLTDAGFSPKVLEISSGTSVRFVNESSSSKASVNSDDYPDNKKYPELNLGVFQKGSTLAHIFKKVQTYTYHDQFKPEHTGTIIVH